MKPAEIRRALEVATAAAREAGALMKKNLRGPKAVDLATQHDIKLELDVRCQRLIERALARSGTGAAVLGEEGSQGDDGADRRWVVDPIDGTVNFAYGIPHACVSIALQERVAAPSSRPPAPDAAAYADGFATLAGVVYEPFVDELWTATDRGPARLNGRAIRVGACARLSEAMVALGFPKQRHTLDRLLPAFGHLMHRVRKIRILGAAALSMTYVATGRLDAYVENGVRLWDIAAAGLILQRAGGVFWRREVDTDRTFEIVASGRPLQKVLQRVARSAALGGKAGS